MIRRAVLGMGMQGESRELEVCPHSHRVRPPLGRVNMQGLPRPLLRTPLPLDGILASEVPDSSSLMPFWIQGATPFCGCCPKTSQVLWSNSDAFLDGQEETGEVGCSACPPVALATTSESLPACPISSSALLRGSGEAKDF